MKFLISPFVQYVRRTPQLRKGAIFCVLLGLLASAAEVVVAITLVPILATLGVEAGDNLGSLADKIPAWAWLGFFVLAAGLRSIANWLSTVQTEQSSQDMVVSLQTRLYRALAMANWEAVRRLSPPNITSALQTQTYDTGYGFSDMVEIVASVLLVTGYIVSAAYVFPTILPFLFLILVSMWYINSRRNERVHNQSTDYVDAQTQLHEHYEDWIAISKISSLGMDAKGLADRFEESARDAASHAVGFNRSFAETRVTYDVAVIAGICIGVPVAWWLETPPALLAFGLVAFIRILPHASNIQTSYQGVVNAIAPMQSVERLTLALENDPAAPSETAPRLAWKTLQLSAIGLEDTQLEGSRRWILRDIDLQLRKGEWIGLNGQTGAGKTTLADIMLMLVRPNSGEISIDGTAVDSALADRWRNQAAYVPQDVVLFDATIRENLKLYAPNATDAELKSALDQAAAEFVISRLADGLDTRAGPGGQWLSGGERQRIGIARVLLRRPGFLVLDEPTAALDASTQARLLDSLANLEQSMCVVIITHRPEVLGLVDRVIELEDGRISLGGLPTNQNYEFRYNDQGRRRR